MVIAREAEWWLPENDTSFAKEGDCGRDRREEAEAGRGSLLGTKQQAAEAAAASANGFARIGDRDKNEGTSPSNRLQKFKKGG